MTLLAVGLLQWFWSSGLHDVIPFLLLLLLFFVAWCAYQDIRMDRLISKLSYFVGSVLAIRYLLRDLEVYAGLYEADALFGLATTLLTYGGLPVALALMAPLAFVAPERWVRRW